MNNNAKHLNGDKPFAYPYTFRALEAPETQLS